MNNRTWFGAMLPRMLRPKPPLPAHAPGPEGEHGGELGWTVGLWRGPDLPPLRLSIRPQSDAGMAGMALRFDPVGLNTRAAPRRDGC